jgi:hypothetical protein
LALQVESLQLADHDFSTDELIYVVILTNRFINVILTPKLIYVIFTARGYRKSRKKIVQLAAFNRPEQREPAEGVMQDSSDAVLKASVAWVDALQSLVAARENGSGVEAEREAVDIAGSQLVVAVMRWRANRKADLFTLEPCRLI